MTRRIACLLLIGLLSVPAVADVVERKGTLPFSLRENRDSPLSVHVGFKGHYKVGAWTLVRVDLRDPADDGDEFIITVLDGDGIPSRVTVALSAGQTSAVAYARFGRVRGNLAVEIRREGDLIAERVLKTRAAQSGAGAADRRSGAVSATRRMIVSIGGGSRAADGADPLGVDAAVAKFHQNPERRPIGIWLEDCRGLPDKWYGYEGIDVLVLSAGQPEVFSGLEPDGPQIAALDEWIRMGGRLVLCVGSRAEEVLATGAPLSVFAPGQFSGMLELRQTRAWEEFAASEVPVPGPADGTGPVFRVPRLDEAQGVVEVAEARLPLVVRAPRGLGQIVFLAADLDRPPLSTWQDRPSLVRRLLDFPESAAEEAESDSKVMHYGFDDVSGQLRSALDQFSNVSLVSFWAAVVPLIVLYILLIGPGDYFLLRKLTRRMQWTWLTFPAVVLAVCLTAVALAHFLKGDQLQFNQLDLVDVDVESDWVRGTSWANVFRPPAESFQTLSLRPVLPDAAADPHARVLFSWLGLPGGGLGGMNPRTANPVPWRESYDFSPALDAMHGVPIPVWATKSFTARWRTRATAGVEGDLADDGQGLSGAIRNQLGFALSDCVLAYDRYAYMVGPLEPDQSVAIDAWLSRSELKTWLTRRHMETSGKSLGSYHAVATPYDRASVQLPSDAVPWPDLARVMLFFEAAGGRQYTGLSHGYQSFVDLSSLLKAGRAVLVARGPADRRTAELLLDGRPMPDRADQHVTIYRFVLPVKTGEGGK